MQVSGIVCAHVLSPSQVIVSTGVCYVGKWQRVGKGVRSQVLTLSPRVSADDHLIKAPFLSQGI